MAKKKTIKILILSFIFSPNVGGVESHLDELCDYLLNKGFRITVITYKPIIGRIDAPFKYKSNRLTIYRIPWIRWNLFNKLLQHPFLQILYLFPGIFIFSFLYLIFNSKKIDVVQSHGFNMAIVAFFLSIVFGKKFNVNTHVSFRFNKKNLYTAILSFVLNKAHKVLVLTENAKKELVKIGVRDTRISVYHYWVDNFFKPIDKTKARLILGLPKSKFIILFVGRFIKEKGVLILANVMKKNPSNTELIMIGQGPLEEKIKELTKEMKNVRIYNSINRTEFPKWYSAADATIIPSFNASSIYSEGIPRVMIESLSCSTPVIATKAGGLKFMLNERVGVFIDPKSSSILKILAELNTKGSRLSAMRKEASVYARTIFSKSTNAAKIYQSLIN